MQAAAPVQAETPASEQATPVTPAPVQAAAPIVTVDQVGGLEIGKCYQFASKNYPGNAFRHRNKEIWLDTIDNNNALYKADSTWKVVKGIAGGEDTISLQSTNYPDWHLRHQGFTMFAHPGDSELYKNDSTFRVKKNGETIAFESVNYPDRLIRHQGYRLKLHQSNGSQLYDDDSNFTPQETQC